MILAISFTEIRKLLNALWLRFRKMKKAPIKNNITINAHINEASVPNKEDKQV